MTQTGNRLKMLAAVLSFAICPVQAENLVLSNLNLIDGTGADARFVDKLVIKDGRIAEAQIKLDGEVTRIDLQGAWVLPGLIDTHVHVARFPDTARQAKLILEQAVRGGITAVRDLGGDARALAEISRALHSREWIGPEIRYAGIYGGESLFADQRIAALAIGFNPGEAPWTQAVNRQSNLGLMVAASKGAGAAGLKIYGNLDAELAAALIQEANRQQMQSWAHATVFPAGPGDLVDAGIDSLSHAAYLVWEAADEIPGDYAARTRGAWQDTPPDHPKLVALFKKMADQGVYLDATLYVYQAMHRVIPPEHAAWAADASAWGAEVTSVAHKLGVAITAGTDWFEPAEGELPHTHAELALLVEQAGLSPMQAIVAGTRNGAGALGILHQRGTIEPGKAADLLVLNSSPLTDIHNTGDIRMVIKDGVMLERD